MLLITYLSHQPQLETFIFHSEQGWIGRHVGSITSKIITMFTFHHFWFLWINPKPAVAPTDACVLILLLNQISFILNCPLLPLIPGIGDILLWFWKGCSFSPESGMLYPIEWELLYAVNIYRLGILCHSEKLKSLLFTKISIGQGFVHDFLNWVSTFKNF